MGGPWGLYLDNNATTPLLPDVAEYLCELLRGPLANPSSAHSLGAAAKRLIEAARWQVGIAIGASPEQIYFVSSGSEANTMALKAALGAVPERDTIVTSQVEHSSIRSASTLLGRRGFRVLSVGVDKDGVIDMDQLFDSISDRTAMVSVQWVNNETGVVQPLDAIRDEAQRHGSLFHCDAAQGFGKIDIDVDASGIDLLSTTGHKINGPQGCGALFARSAKYLSPVITGGGQEHGLRGGTENVLGIAGFGLAAHLRHQSVTEVRRHMAEYRDAFEKRVLEGAGAVVNGSIKARVCNTTNLRFPGIDGRMLVARLDEAGIYCSQSSACTSMTPEPSYVLRAMGLSENEAYASIRFSFGVLNTVAEATEAALTVCGIYKRLLEVVRIP